MSDDPVGRILAAYPVIHHACRQRAVPARPARAVSAHQATVLAHLDRLEGQSLTDLARRMGVALPTMSLLLGRLVRAGLVRRDRDPGDRRRLLVRLTALGDRVRASRSLLDPDRVRALLQRLTPAEQSLGADGMATLARAAGELGPPIGGSAPPIPTERGRS